MAAGGGEGADDDAGASSLLLRSCSLEQLSSKANKMSLGMRDRGRYRFYVEINDIRKYSSRSLFDDTHNGNDERDTYLL